MIKLGLSIDDDDQVEEEDDMPGLVPDQEAGEDTTNKMEDVDWFKLKVYWKFCVRVVL